MLFYRLLCTYYVRRVKVDKSLAMNQVSQLYSAYTSCAVFIRVGPVDVGDIAVKVILAVDAILVVLC